MTGPSPSEDPDAAAPVRRDPPGTPGADPPGPVVRPAPPIPPQPPADSPARRGRPLGSIAAGVGPTHRVWLESLRSSLVASPYTIDDLVTRTGGSKTRLSNLLRGQDYYPRWQITYSVARVLNLPAWPLRRLWTAAAREANKDPVWIKNCIHEVQNLTRTPPIAYDPFTEDVRPVYRRYARALLPAPKADWVVNEVFDILWITWNHAAASADIRRYAWRLLRSRVMLRARLHEGYPDLAPAAFTTVAPSRIEDPEDRLAHIAETAAVFGAISRLPQDQFDVLVLRYLCGLEPDRVPYILGMPPSRVGTLDRHARGALESDHDSAPSPHDDPGECTPQ